jgi:hypothetical protein
MDHLCEYCNKSFDTKNKVTSHQKTKKCQQFRAITFICRNCSSAIIGYDNILEHVDSSCKTFGRNEGGKPILHCEIIEKINATSNVFGKGFNGKPSYIFNYEKNVLTYGTQQPVSEKIVTAIEDMFEKCTLKSLKETLQSFSKTAILKEIALEYPQPYSISDIGRFMEFESRSVMAFLMTTNITDLFRIIVGKSKIIPVAHVNDKIYVLDKVTKNDSVWSLEWKLNNIKEVTVSLKGLFIPALKYAVKLFLKEGPNDNTAKILGLIKDLNNPEKVADIINCLGTILPTYKDVHNVLLESKYIFNGPYKHTPMDTFINSVYGGEGDPNKIKSLVLDMADECEKDSLKKKLNLNDDDISLEVSKLSIA